MACANFTAMKLEGTVAGMIPASTLEISTVATLLSGLVAWKLSPPPPMLMMVCSSSPFTPPAPASEQSWTPHSYCEKEQLA